MKVLVVGSGGREHAICVKLAESKLVDKLYCIKGNAGISKIAECVDLDVTDISGICGFALKNEIDLAVIGPEDPLAMGITDELTACGIKVFGPDKSCARLEASKDFTKEFLIRNNIPTAKYEKFTDAETLISRLDFFGYPVVIKADGLAAGKGVVIANNRDEAVATAHMMMCDRKFGNAGDTVLLEEFLTGVEASILCFVDENNIIPMESAQDYKRAFDEDKGGNTGGMGSYSPSLLMNDALKQEISEKILQPTLRGFQKEGLKFKGVLFIGLMLGKDGPKVIEFNVRFGDPETQSILMRLESDLAQVMLATAENRLSEIELKWSEKTALFVVLASGGYPENYEKGKAIMGLEDVDKSVSVLHCGTSQNERKEIVTAGGRVLCIGTLASDNEEARHIVYEEIKKVSFAGMQYRKDIGKVYRA